jgi:hypothetical protein
MVKRKENTAHFKHLIAQEKARMLDNEEHGVQLTFAFISLSIGLPIAAINPLPSGFFVGVGIFFYTAGTP